MEKDRAVKETQLDVRAVNQPSIETRITDVVRLGVVGLLAYWSLTLIAPFAIIMIWACILTVALYPSYAALRNFLGGRGRLAAAIITLASLLIIIGPLAAIALSFMEAAQSLIAKLNAGTIIVPTPPESVRDLPVVGDRVFALWSLASSNLETVFKRFEPSLLHVGSTAISKIASIGLGLLSFVVSVLVAGFLFAPGPQLGENIKRFARRVAGERGVGFVKLATATIRNVARGVIGVAVVQALLSAIVLTLFDIPAPGVITFIVLVLCIMQIGPALVFLPVLVWAWTTMAATTALVLTLLLIPIGLIDNVMKPVLVARGLSTPMLVILIGVLGGTLSYGLIGLFLGPIVLSVFYDLLVVWVRPDNQTSDQPPAA
jgi:predicted PurR-regulated permease PerM